jgi:PAS domain S-box-containing protein
VKKPGNNDHLNFSLNSVNVPVIIWDRRQNVVFLNKAFEEMSGRSDMEMAGQPADVLFPEKSRSDLSQKIESASRGEEYKGMEIPILNKDGTIRVGLWNFSRISAGDIMESVVVIAAGQDITRRKKIEEQTRHAYKMEAVGVLAGGIAHDFNNVLQSVSGYIQLLLMRKAKDDPDCDYLDKVEQLIHGTKNLIRQLLIFGRRTKGNLKPVDINQEVRQMKAVLERLIPKMISIEMNLCDDLKPVNMNPTKIKQTIMNLMINARDAMSDGGRLIVETENTVLNEEYCALHLGATPGRYVLLAISDTGCGMDSKTLKHIFEPFYTTKEVGKGTGLGLAIVYGTVKDSKGYITCDSEPGQGTIFRLYFPAFERVVENVEQTPEHKGLRALYSDNESILLVDDNKSILDIACDMLGQYDYRTVAAGSGEEAVEIYERKGDQIDLVILDIGMPGMGGHNCFKELLRINPKIKVLIATGYSVNGKVKETIEAGAAGFIGKPYRLIDLVKKVREVLDGRQAVGR